MHNIAVSIVYATAKRQWLEERLVPRGTNASELIEQSSFMSEIPDLHEIAAEELVLGVYAKKIEPDYLLQDGDRVEIYRPLTADPKEVRRQLAKLGKTMGKP